MREVAIARPPASRELKRRHEGRWAILRRMVDITVVDGLFGELLALSGPYLTEAEKEEVQQLLNQAEYPAALETFVYIFVDGGKSATQNVFALITRLTGMLHMQLDDTISKIPRLPPG